MQIEPLTEAELAAQQQPIDASTLAGRRTLSLDSLISLNLAEDAIVAFAETETPDVADLDAPLLDHSICEVALNPQQTVPNSICPPSPTVENSTASSNPTGAGEETSGRNAPEVAVSPPSSHATPPSYSVQSISNGGGSARSYYNLSIRPPAQFSNGNLNLLFPLSIPAAITSAFGWRTHPITGDVRFHSGTDIGAPQGTPVLAAFDGQVEVSDFVGGYGLTVVLQHSNGTEQTLYAHLSEIFVRPGEQVKQGEVIGRVGSTGMSTGPHLHFEFRRMTQEGWTVVNAGPALEYALTQIGRSPLLAQANSQTELPSLFQYSGKFLDLVRVASQDKDKDEKGS
ncbi:hypothetical protein C7B76_28965 [filamentous cyanobacterium CCP2]|nr:hypothetical protein C7B76_28965 [filamentous cyanobacterium CCP2]